MFWSATRLSAGFASLLLAGVFAPLGDLQATQPELNYINPQGGQRGTEIDVVLFGKRLSDGQELLFDEPGIEMLELTPRKKNSLNVRLKIASDCRLGIHAIWLRTATGLSNLRTFHIGALPEAEEVEPNNDFAAPQPIELGTVVNGVAEPEDVDFYSVEAKKGERISCEIEGMRLGRRFFDPFIAILDARRFKLAQSDDSALLGYDGVCSIVAPADGQYVIEVREAAYQGGRHSWYRLHVGRFPRPTAIYPAGGKPGETLEVRWLGDPLGEWTEKITLPTKPTRNFGLVAHDEQGPAPSANPFRLSELNSTLEVEPNDNREQANSATAPGAVNGIIQTPGDIDFFKFGLKQGETYTIRVFARDLRTPLDSVLDIYNSKGDRLSSNDDNVDSPDSYLRFKVPEDGEYTIAIRDHLEAGGADYVYRVEMTQLAPAIKVGIAEFDQHQAMLPAVPRGNSTALLVTTVRENFSGELQLDMPALPPGVTWKTMPVPPDRSSTAVVLSAAADAPLSDKTLPLRARPTDEKIKVEGSLIQQHSLVRGSNSGGAWSYWGEELPLAVTEAVPFSIEVVQPKAPLVQRGSMKLKVLVNRREGFDAPVQVKLLENPPGVSSSAAIKIAKGKTDAEIPLSANDKAAVGVSPIVVTATAEVDGGRVLISSDIIPLEVATPYFTFSLEKAVVEQGQKTQLRMNVEQLKAFPGKAEVELVGLPSGAVTETLQINQNAKQLQFPITVAKETPTGLYKSIMCRAIVMIHGEPVMHTFGPYEVRINKPLPPPKN